jgi:succinate-semialdehyde dehydrogenase/glutarate-semialdehyde dehydrogenase
MPWNFPFYQVIRFAIPSLMETQSFKHASNVQGCFAIEDAFIKAGLRSIYEFECGIKRGKTL